MRNTTMMQLFIYLTIEAYIQESALWGNKIKIKDLVPFCQKHHAVNLVKIGPVDTDILGIILPNFYRVIGKVTICYLVLSGHTALTFTKFFLDIAKSSPCYVWKWINDLPIRFPMPEQNNCLWKARKINWLQLGNRKTNVSWFILTHISYSLVANSLTIR